MWTTLIFIAAIESNSVTSFVVGECSEIVAADERRLRWKDVRTMCSKLEVTCNLLKCPETDAWMKWYTEDTCLNANKSVTAPKHREREHEE
jgi:hypothetical protein